MKRPLIDRCRKLRKTPTDAEKKLWAVLRNRQLNGVKFRRQFSVEHYILDCYSPEYKLAIEADGGQHFKDNGIHYDTSRANTLEAQGIKILRFSNTDILNYINGVCEIILREIEKRPPHLNPLPSGRGGNCMLTEEEKTVINAELQHCEWKESASVEALKVVQKMRGWVSDASIAEIAALLDMTPAELDAVATFYSFIFRKPVGRHVISICDSMVCWSLGYNALHDRLSTRLGIAFGETTKDNRFTLLPAACLGACDRAPAMMVDDDLYGPVTPETIEGILAKYT